MKIFDAFKRKVADNQKPLTLEDCVVKMFASAGITPVRNGNKFSTEVQGKHCAFDVALTCGAESDLIVCVPFIPLPIDKNVAYAVNYEVKRICKESVEKFPGTIIRLVENDEADSIIALTLKKFDKLSDNTPDEIRKAMIQTVDILDDKNFASLISAIFGYESYEEVKMNMNMNMNMNMEAVSADGNKVHLQLKDGYRELLGKTPALSNSRYLGRLMAYATHILMAKDNDELLTRAAGALSKSFDGFIQEVYDIAADGERNLIRKLRYLGKARNEDDCDDEDFAEGRNEAKRYLEASGDSWKLVYGEDLSHPDEAGSGK